MPGKIKEESEEDPGRTEPDVVSLGSCFRSPRECEVLRQGLAKEVTFQALDSRVGVSVVEKWKVPFAASPKLQNSLRNCE
jgi:hypothetical protein